MKPIIKTMVVGAVLAGMASCTKLDPKINATIPEEDFRRNADIPGLLRGAYNSFRGPFQDQTGVFSLQDMTSDDAIGPTRGGDWDDNGVWRVLHTHNWTASNQRIVDNFNNLLQIVFNATNVLDFNPSASVAAEARMLRAYAMFYVLDLYDQVPVREPGENLLLPAQVLQGTAALDRIIADLQAALPNLPEAPVYRANKAAARALLMKCYLNRGVYANRQQPTFAAADMDQVIALGNEIINSGRFQLDDNFFTQFTPENSETSKEIIFANQNTETDAGNVRFHYFASTHYNQNPSGWNGFTTLATFYDKFEATDQRRGIAFPRFTDSTGMRVGLLVGQQFGKGGVPLKDRAGNPLVFTREITPIVTGNVELPGIRVVKYVPDMKPDYSAPKDVASNDYVLLRYADVMLMVAEAQLRKGNAGAALAIVNQIRAKRGASQLAAVTTDNLLDERGRELYWESWRRNDLVRFGKFLDPYGPTKPNKSDVKYLVFPIPGNALAVNPNLKQNPGYAQ
ncbi:Starch-binding associating with outer membrane [Cnuella takakiae]|uniref:Starch-binding associating with outer membrane n=1 Tax=Cnuella takakiae TaxID=1302690 RepID=A0A1M5H7B5_9BACT|nr:RagB/SusD family nutrient uptake outer membrane protein [Cnuella takakiae]OLY91092.1 hypothetical protein BUE76_03630 [Cnuella takakiae]SHG11602.1 Starch-binding associating with outer membrane [Cnuella takakiae]